MSTCTAGTPSSALALLLALLVPAAGPLAEGGGDPAYERSLELVRRAQTGRPDEPRLLEVLGRVHFRRGRFEEAARVFEDASRRATRPGELLLALGACREKQGDLAASEAVFQKALAIDDAGVSMRARLTLASHAFERGDYAEAVRGLREAIQKGNKSAETYYQLGRALDSRARALGQAAPAKSEAELAENEAVEALRQAIALDAGHAQAHYVLGMLLSRRGQRDEGRRALEAYRRLHREVTGIDIEKLEQADTRFEALTAVEVGRALLDLGDGGGALAHAGLALRIHPDLVEGLALGASVHRRSESAAEAARLYMRILELEPDHAEALWNLGTIDLRAGRVEEAAPRLLRATEIRRGPAEAWELLTRLALERGLYKERGEEFARQALRLRPSAGNFESLAMVCFGAGKHAEAEKILREGLERFPDSRELRAGLEAVRSRAGGAR